MKIYIDADACPVKDIIISEGTNAEIPVILVTSFSHFSNAEQPSGWKPFMLILEQMLRIIGL